MVTPASQEDKMKKLRMHLEKERAGLVPVDSGSIGDSTAGGSRGGDRSRGRGRSRRKLDSSHRSSSRRSQRSRSTVRSDGGGSTKAAPRRFRASQETRAKFKSVIHRLVTINRFQQEALQQQAAADADGAISGGASSGNDKSSRLARAASTSMSMSAAKAMDSYIKEQSDIYAYAEQRNVAEDEEHLPFLIVHPEANSKVTWDLLLLGMVIFFGFSVPYRLGFDIQLSPSEEMFDVVSDILFLVDIVVNFRTAYKDDGILITDFKMIATNYLSFWFPIDVLASFPIGWFTSGAGGVNKLFKMLRLFKLFRMLRLLKLFPRLFQMLETSIKFNPSMIRFLRSFAIMFMMWHNIGCAYWFVAREEYMGLSVCPEGTQNPGRSCYVNNCICDDDTQEQVVLNITDASWYDPYYPDRWVPDASYAYRPYSQQYS